MKTITIDYDTESEIKAHLLSELLKAEDQLRGVESQIKSLEYTKLS